MNANDRTRYGFEEKDFQHFMNEFHTRCWICEMELTNGTRNVDHDHELQEILLFPNRLIETRKTYVRGLLCSNCNLGIGNFANDPNRLVKAAAFLVEPPYSKHFHKRLKFNKDENRHILPSSAYLVGLHGRRQLTKYYSKRKDQLLNLPNSIELLNQKIEKNKHLEVQIQNAVRQLQEEMKDYEICENSNCADEVLRDDMIVCDLCDRQVCTDCGEPECGICEEVIVGNICSDCYTQCSVAAGFEWRNPCKVKRCGVKLSCDDCIGKVSRCQWCRKDYCQKCFTTCEVCDNDTCNDCQRTCWQCTWVHCPDCVSDCARCEIATCNKCLEKCQTCRNQLCGVCINNCPGSSSSSDSASDPDRD